MHTHYVQTGAATGRLSSKDPNLQNIPVREEEGRRIRRAFVPAPGSVFVSADYAQVELAILAHLSGDPVLLGAFRAGKDVHRETAALIFGVAEDAVTPDMRRIGKTINFGVIYGMSAFGLAQSLKIGRADADRFIRTYFERFAGRGPVAEGHRPLGHGEGVRRDAVRPPPDGARPSAARTGPSAWPRSAWP